MAIIFPPINTASPEGLLAIGGSLNEETLLTAYTQGIFPWPISAESPLTWFSPDPRGVLYTDDFHCSKSLLKFLRNTKYKVKFNVDFEMILRHCAKVPRKHEAGTWITQDIVDGYLDFFKAGYVYCVGVYENDNLIGGLYGVTIGNFISGESMFHLKTNASKMALYYLVSILKLNSISILDTQMVTPIIESVGGGNISRDNFIKELRINLNIAQSRSKIFNYDFEDLRL